MPPGCGTSTQQGSQSFDQTSQTTFAPASQQEQDLLNQISQLGGLQGQNLTQLLTHLNSGASPFALDPASQALLDQSYQGAQQQLDLSNKQYADYLAGGRGLRMSDTPISQQAIQMQGLGQSALSSAKANQSLNMGLAGSQFNVNAGLGLAGAMPTGLSSAYQSLLGQRMAQGSTHTYGTGVNQGSNTQSLMQSILQGMQGVGSASQGVGTGIAALAAI